MCRCSRPSDDSHLVPVLNSSRTFNILGILVVISYIDIVTMLGHTILSHLTYMYFILGIPLLCNVTCSLNEL